LLRATDRRDEAESLMRRQLAILVEVTRRTGHSHPRFQAAVTNYRNLLKAMGKSQAEIEAGYAELLRPLEGTNINLPKAVEES
jgi:hypothetical protein